jgi:hypothetical protein
MRPADVIGNTDGRKRQLCRCPARTARAGRRRSGNQNGSEWRASADEDGGSSASVANLIDGQHRILEMGEVPHARKKGQFRAHAFGELHSLLLVDVEVFLAPKRPSRTS